MLHFLTTLVSRFPRRPPSFIKKSFNSVLWNILKSSQIISFGYIRCTGSQDKDLYLYIHMCSCKYRRITHFRFVTSIVLTGSCYFIYSFTLFIISCKSLTLWVFVLLPDEIVLLYLLECYQLWFISFRLCLLTYDMLP